MSDTTEWVVDMTLESYRIKEGVRVICNEAFAGCYNLHQIILPSSLNFIGENAFKGCVKLNEIILPDSLVYISDGAFDCEDRLSACKRYYPLKVCIPPSVIMIEGNPFCNNAIIECHNVRFKVVDNVLYSSDGTVLISFCSSTDDFYIPDGVIRIGVAAFRGAHLGKIHFPSTMEIIDKRAFEDAHIDEDIVLPSSLKEIREDAFNWCKIKSGSIVFSSKVEHISPDIFGYGLDGFDIITVPKGCLDYYKSILYEWDDIIYDEEIVFDNYLHLSRNRSEVLVANKGTKNFVIPEGVVSIRDNAFKGIYSIDSICLPLTLKRITRNAFDKEILELKKIIVPKGMTEYYSTILREFKDVIEECN